MPISDTLLSLSKSELLKLKLCDLKLKLNQTPVHALIQQLYHELKSKDLVFRPHFWLSNEWFSPDGIPGVAIPFYLAHPRLIKLEREMMLEAEGDDREICMKILRHEAGHAIDNAFRLRRKKERTKAFGHSTLKYPKMYVPKPYSKKYVRNLHRWYAQSHPDEDFAETFAVWLDPSSNWVEWYRKWPAYKKLLYMDKLMHSLMHKKQPVQSKTQLDPLSSFKETLETYYSEKRKYYQIENPKFNEQKLKKIFSGTQETNVEACKFIQKNRHKICSELSKWTGVYRYTINSLLSEILVFTKNYNLRLDKEESETLHNFLMYMTVQTMNFVHRGYHHQLL